MTSIRFAFLSCATFGIALLPALALAQQDPTPVAQFNHAADLAEAGQYEEAVKLWKDLEGVLPSEHLPTLHAYLGLAYSGLGRLPEAWHYLALHVGEAPEPASDAAVELRSLEKRLASSHARVKIECDPAGALVKLGTRDDPLLLPCPLTWWLPTGSHTISAFLTGHEDADTVVDVPPGTPPAARDVRLVLAPLPGTLVVRGATSDFTISVDDGPKSAPPQTLALPAGRHKVHVGLPDGSNLDHDVTVAPGNTVVVDVDTIVAQGLPAPASPPDGPSPDVLRSADHQTSDHPLPGAAPFRWALVGAGFGAAASGGALHYLAWSRESDLREKYPDVPGSPDQSRNRADYASDRADSVVPLQNTAFVLYAVGAAAAATGLAWIVLSGRDDSTGAAAVVQVVTWDKGLVLGSVSFAF